MKVERMPFGKYEGVALNAIPSWYLKWLLWKSEVRLSADLQDAIEEVLFPPRKEPNAR